MRHKALLHVYQAREQPGGQEAGAGAAQDNLVTNDSIQLSKKLLLQL